MRQKRVKTEEMKKLRPRNSCYNGDIHKREGVLDELVRLFVLSKQPREGA